MVSGIARHTNNRGHRDYSSVPCLHHRPQRCTRNHHGGRHVDVQNFVPFIVLHTHRQIVTRDTGIVDEDRNRGTRGIGSSIDQPRSFTAVRQIRRHHMRVVPQLCGKFGEPFSARTVERHCGTAGMKRACYGGTDSAAGACHECRVA